MLQVLRTQVRRLHAEAVLREFKRVVRAELELLEVRCDDIDPASPEAR